MNKIFIIAKKELAWYFNNPAGYVLLGLFAALSNFLAIRDILLRNQATIDALSLILPWLALVLVAVVAMRSIAEERKNGTLEILLTLPLSQGEIILGKFFGLGMFMLTAIITVLPIPLTLTVFGRPDWGIIIAGLLAILFFVLTLLTIGLFISSITQDQVAAVFTSLVVFFLIMVIGTALITDQVPKFMREAFFFISPIARYQNMARGVIDFRDVVYFLSLIGGFLYLSIEVLKRER